MSTTVSSVIEAARDVHSEFSERNIPPGTAIRLLDRTHKRIYAKTSETNPDTIALRSAEVTVSTNSEKLTGYSLPQDMLQLMQVYQRFEDGTQLPLTLVDSYDEGNLAIHPCAYVRNGKLYPIDPTYGAWSDEVDRTGWANCDALVYDYVPIASKIVQIKAGAALAISATAEMFKTVSAFTYYLGDMARTKPATDLLVFSAADTVNFAGAAPALFGAWLVQIDEAGTITTKPAGGLSDQVYTTALAAFDALPAPTIDNYVLGYITVNANTTASWTANTDNMTDASDCLTTVFTSLTAINLTTPDSAFDALVSDLAYRFALRRGGPLGGHVFAECKRDAADALGTYLALIDNQVQSEVRYVRVID